MINSDLKQLIVIIYLFSLGQLQAQTYLSSLSSPADFDKMASLPLSEKYSNVASVKVIYDIHSDKVYFIQSEDFKFHYTFCTQILSEWHDIPYFNDHNYHESESRDYRLATINWYKDADLITFEFSTSEVLAPPSIAFYHRVKKLVQLPHELQLFPSGAKQIDYVKAIRPAEDFITADVIYHHQKYQALNQTYSYGYLRFIAIDSLDKINENDIVIVNGTPLEMPFCRGVITTDFQPPLSHIVVLSHNRRTPIMALKNVWNNQELRDLEGKLVKFTVENDKFTIQEADKKQAQYYWKTRSHHRPIKLDVNIEKRGIQSISRLSSKSVNIVGGKAANFGELNRIYIDKNQKIRLPKAAFAIPFSHYHDHVQQRGIQEKINAVIANEALRDNPQLLREKLKEIRQAIVQAPLDKWLLADVERLVAQNGIFRLRFRSSTNAEDIAGFNGAGLYDSKTGILGDPKKSIEKAIKKVWASLWNYRAFQERAFFNIDQSTVAMGILVHQSFPNEEANGVAITKNIYRPERTGFVVNIQKGDVSIVLPPDGVTSELFVIKQNINAENEIEIDYISYSSLQDNQPLLTIQEIEELNKILAAIKQHFFANLNAFTRPFYNDFALDIEFKIEEQTRKIIIKQVREYGIAL